MKVAHLILLALAQTACALRLGFVRSQCAFVRAHHPHMAADDLEQKLVGLRATLSGLETDGYGQEVLGPLQTKLANLELQLERERALEGLQATLRGLKDDGYGADVLAPLEAKIAALEAGEAGEAAAPAPPALSPDQQRIYDLCDSVDAERARTDDEDAPKRIEVLRSERRFLLNSMLRADRTEYAEMLSALADRELADDDYPSICGVAVASVAALEEALAAEEALSAAKAKAQDEASRVAVVPDDVAARKQAALDRTDGSFDLGFVRAFVLSEEYYYEIPNRVVDEGMWTAAQDMARLQSFRGFLEKLSAGDEFSAARVALAMADPLAKALDAEAKDPAFEGAPVAQRAKEAWGRREEFIERWPQPTAKGRAPKADSGLSPIARMRQLGDASDPMSKRRVGDKDEKDATDKLNKWFEDFLKGS